VQSPSCAKPNERLQNGEDKAIRELENMGLEQVLMRRNNQESKLTHCGLWHYPCLHPGGSVPSCSTVPSLSSI
jgi:hypothetical protein